MSATELVNTLIKIIELSQSRGAFKLEESKFIFDTIVELKKVIEGEKLPTQDMVITDDEEKIEI